MTMHDLGVIHGRFQILHNDHLTYLLAGKKRCRHLVIAITNPEPELTAQDDADPHRSTSEANPFSYYERYRMVYAAMRSADIAPDLFSIVPLPINFPERYGFYVPLEAVFFLTIYDQWGERKLQLFNDLNLRTEILWKRPLAQKGLNSTFIRSLIDSGQAWEHLVPEGVVPIIKNIRAQHRK